MKNLKIFKTVCLITTIGILIFCSGCVVTRKNFNNYLSCKDDIEKMIYYGSLAGNTHNTQPWIVEIINDNEILIKADFSRKLEVVDPNSRGLFISIGAFIENFCIAAESFGYSPLVNLVVGESNDNSVAHIILYKSAKLNHDLTELEKRTTLRIPFEIKNIDSQDIKKLTENVENYHVYQTSSTEADYIKSQTIRAYTKQANSQKAKNELEKWIRFSNKDVKIKRDGLTTAGMGMTGFTGIVVSNFFKPSDSQKQSFVDKGIQKTIVQAENCGAWLIITQPKYNPENWIETGRLYQRFHIKCRSLNIGFHPMNQMIEDPEFEKKANDFLGLNEPIQLVARIGYVKNYPNPVSVRRDIHDFIIDNRY